MIIGAKQVRVYAGGTYSITSTCFGSPNSKYALTLWKPSLRSHNNEYIQRQPPPLRTGSDQWLPRELRGSMVCELPGLALYIFANRCKTFEKFLEIINAP